jgi:NAD(P)-dependent dehydrogenase (short-subunit alcohol dehydrogenase family)
MQKVALVTGGNRGIGLETCRQLGQQGFHVVLTSRDPSLGQEASDSLLKEGLEISFQQLDVTIPEQISEVCDLVMAEYDRVDVLVNNAGVNLDGNLSIWDVPDSTFEETFAVNFFGPTRLTRKLIPVMKSNNYGRVVNVSSGLGSLSAMGNMPGRMPAYRISKAALNALTILMASEVKDFNIKINTMSPEWVRTRMGGPGAPRDVEQGVDTIIWLATLPAKGPTGGFFMDRKRHPW